MTEVKKIKIGLMTYSIDGRKAKGTAIVARKAVEALLERRDDFELVYLHYEKTIDPIYDQSVHEIVFPKFNEKYLNFLNFRFFRQIYYFLTTKDRFDITFWFQPRLYPFFWLAPAKKLIAILHGAGDVYNTATFDWSRLMYVWTLKLFGKKLDMSIAVSNDAKMDLAKCYGLRKEKISVVYNGVNEIYNNNFDLKTVKNNLISKYGFPEKYILCVSRWDPNKNILNLLNAYKKYLDKSNQKNTLVFVGGKHNPDYSDQADKLIKELGLESKIFIAPFIDTEDMVGIYQAAEFLVFPSISEGFGMPLVEAFACGCPVVCSDIPVFKEIGQDTCLYFDPNNVEIMKDQMLYIENNHDMVKNLKDKALIRARDFTWSEMKSQTVKIIKSVI